VTTTGVGLAGRSSRGRVGRDERPTGVTSLPPRLGSGSRLIRDPDGTAGLSTAPVGLTFNAPPSFGVLATETGSRPLKTRRRRRSLSSATPGVRGAAPVGLARPAPGMPGAGRAALTRPAAFVLLPGTTAGLTGRSPRKGCAPTTRRARSLLAGCGRTARFPKSRAGTAVTARR
jgi:hypothetical protein